MAVTDDELRKLLAENADLRAMVEAYRDGSLPDLTAVHMGAAKDATDKLRAEVEKLRAALEFYADKEAWSQPPVKTYEGLFTVEYENAASKVRQDRGRIARAALEGGAA